MSSCMAAFRVLRVFGIALCGFRPAVSMVVSSIESRSSHVGPCPLLIAVGV